MIDEAMKRYIIAHRVYIDSHLACFFLNYVYNGNSARKVFYTETFY